MRAKLGLHTGRLETGQKKVWAWPGDVLIRNLVLPQQIHSLFLQDRFPCCWARSIVEDGSENLDVFFWLGEEACTTGLHELVLFFFCEL